MKNYIAYDDGTAEAGYGLVNAKSGKVAVQFQLNTKDTLSAIAFHLIVMLKTENTLRA